MVNCLGHTQLYGPPMAPRTMIDRYNRSPHAPVGLGGQFLHAGFEVKGAWTRGFLLLRLASRHQTPERRDRSAKRMHATAAVRMQGPGAVSRQRFAWEGGSTPGTLPQVVPH